MKIKLLVNITGTIDGQEWPERGGVIDIAEHVAADMIYNGFAEAVETAAVDPVKETAAKPAARTRKA